MPARFPNQEPLAVVGMACHLPGAKGLDDYWRLLIEGRSAIKPLPADRLDRELYFDSRKGQVGTTYLEHAGTIDYPAFDPRRCEFPTRLAPYADVGHLRMCQVAAEACADAGFDPFDVAPTNCGVYLGNNNSGSLATETAYAAMAGVVAQGLDDLEELQALAQENRQAYIDELVHRIRRGRPRIRRGGSLNVAFHVTANAVSESLGLTGPSMVLDAACSSSLKALSMAAADLRQGMTEMAIVGGASYTSSDGMLIFSSAQAGSERGVSCPFSDQADGLVPAEGYVAILVKTLRDAVAAGDPIRFIIRGIGISSDGRGKSLWAPIAAGQVLAMNRAYGHGAEKGRIAYLEAHATSTARGDQTELEAIHTAFADRFDRKIPLGGVKANIGHVLEPAGLAGLVKSALVLENRVAPQQINSTPLNSGVDWDAAPYFVPSTNTPLTEPSDGKPLQAAVNAFGIGGLNAHVVIEEPPASSSVSISSPAQVPRPEPIAVIGVGALMPGAHTWEALADLILGDGDPQQPTPAERLAVGAGGDCSAEPVDGGYLDGWQYDWRRRRIAPKVLQTANPLQFMILDCCDAALASAGYDDDRLDRKHTGVLVGSRFESDFSSQLAVGFRLPHLRRELAGVLQERGYTPGEQMESVVEAFAKNVLQRMPALLDDSGSFTPSSLCSRITKTLDLGGGGVTIDTGNTVALAAVAQAVSTLRSGECDTLLCAVGGRAMGPTSVERQREEQGRESPLGEGAGVLVLKRLADAQRDGDPIRAVIHGVAAGYDGEPTKAFEQAIDRAWNQTDKPRELVQHVEISPTGGAAEAQVCQQAYRLAAATKASDQLGDLLGASGMASLLRAFRELERLSRPEQEHSPLAAISSWDICGSAYHLILEHGSPSAVEESQVSGEPSSTDALAAFEPWRIARFGAATADGLLATVQQAIEQPKAAFATCGQPFTPRDHHRLSFVVSSAEEMASQLEKFLKLAPAGQASLLARNGVHHAEVRESRGPIAFVFPGQGSQYEGMLRSLVEGYAPAREIVAQLDQELTAQGCPVWADLAWQNGEQLGKDVFRTQLSLLVANTIVLRCLATIGVMPDVVTGHSFGEFPALHASGAWSFTEAIKATRARCDAIVGCDQVAGGMISVAAEESAALRLCQLAGEGVYVANANSPEQTVLGCSPAGLEAIRRVLQTEGVAGKVLAVNRPFHTPLMESIREPLRNGLANIKTIAPKLPILSSVTNEYVHSAEAARENLVAQLTQPVRYVELINRLRADGVNTFVECGPRYVLTGLHAKRLDAAGIAAVSADHPKQDGVRQLLSVRACLEAQGHDFDEQQPRDVALNRQAEVGQTTIDLLRWGREHRDEIRTAMRRMVAAKCTSPSARTQDERTLRSLAEVAAGAGVLPETLQALLKLTSAEESAELRAALESNLWASPSSCQEQDSKSPTDPAAFRIVSSDDFRRLANEAPPAGASAERFLPSVLEKPLPTDAPCAHRITSRVLIVGDNAVSQELRRRLQADGAECVVLSNRQSHEAASAELDRAWAEGPLAHLALMTSFDDDAATACDPTAWTQREEPGVVTPLAITGHWLKLIKQADLLSQASALAATQLGGDFGFSGQATCVESAAIAALAKSLIHEAGVPTDFAFQTTLVDFDGEHSPAQIVERLLAEAAAATPYELEVGYARGKRYVVRPIPAPVEQRDESAKPSGVWIVTGGGRGITALVASEIAKRYGVELHLLGSSPPPNCPPAWRGLDENAKRALCAQVFADAKAAGKSPPNEWRRVQRIIELDESLQAMIAAGVHATYHQCDVTDHIALATKLDQIRQTAGPITGVLHGAGIEISTRLETKDPAIVGKTFAIKTTAAAALIELTRNDPLRHFIGFGSITGRVGCPGQADYAMANETLAKMLALYQRQRPDCRTICFDWGPWEEVGMAARPESRGNSVLSKLTGVKPADGLQHALDELLATDRTVETLMVGRDVYNIFYVDRTPEAQPPVESTALQSGAIEADPGEIRRMVIRWADAEWPTADLAKIRGRALVVGDSQDADALAMLLRSSGVPVAHHRRLENSSNMDEAHAIVERAWRSGPVTHVFLATARDSDARQIDQPEIWAQRAETGLIGPYRLLSAWLQKASSEGTLSTSAVVGLTALGGDLGLESGPDALEGSGLAGVLKAVHAEHGGASRDSLRVKVLDAGDDCDAEVLAKAALAEATGECTEVESAYSGGQRRLPRVAYQEVTALTPNPPRRGGTWVVTGGARGITAEVAIGLGKAFDLDLHLLGTRPKPQIDESLRYLSDEELKPFKREVVRQALRDGVKPEDAWGPWRRDFEIDRNLRRMASEGVRVTYHECDVTNPARLAEVLNEVRARSGPIHGLVHGAGIQGIPTNVRDMLESSVDSARRTLDIKVAAALEMLRLLANDPLEHVVGFGSISGRFGSNSASFYCAGTDMLCKIMGRLRKQRPGCRAVGFHWHGWSDVGMITRPEGLGTAKILKLELLSPADGVKHLVDELQFGTPESEVVVTNAKYIELYHPRHVILGLGKQPPAAVRQNPLLEEVTVAAEEPGASVAKLLLNPSTDPFLTDHRYQQRPLLPAVIIAEAFAEATRAAGGRTPIAIHDLVLHSGLRLHTDDPTPAEVRVDLADGHGRCQLVADFRNRRGQLVEAARLHASAVVELSDQLPTLTAPYKESTAEWHEVWYPDPENVMYHGPTFQRMKRCALEPSGEGWGEVFASDLADVGGPRGGVGWASHPALIDAALYLCGIAVWFGTGGGVALPKRFDRIRFGAMPKPAEQCLTHIRGTGPDPSEASFDITCFGADRRVLFAIDGYRAQIIGAPRATTEKSDA